MAQGTPVYLAPEATDGLHGKARYSSAVDVFAFGILLWNMFYGEVDPYRGRRLFQGFQHGAGTRGSTERPQFVEAAEPAAAGGNDSDSDGRVRIKALAKLAARCWAQESEDRPSFVEIEAELAWI